MAAMVEAPDMMARYKQILTGFSDCGITVGVFDSTKSDGETAVFQVDPLTPLKASLTQNVILKLFLNAEEIGKCTGTLTTINASRVDAPIPEGQDPDDYEVPSFVIYWIHVNRNHMGKNIGILLLHLMMINVILRMEGLEIFSFHLEDDSDNPDSKAPNNIYNKSGYILQKGKDPDQPERFLTLTDFMTIPLPKEIIPEKDGVAEVVPTTLEHKITEYIAKLKMKTMSSFAPAPPLIELESVGQEQEQEQSAPGQNQRKYLLRSRAPKPPTIIATPKKRGKGKAESGGKKTRRKKIK
jgi:hypothetical protein